ncbi:respiratory nitrate reductase subunit gamma [Bacillaceae bacterium S4-13-58]
MDWILWGILPYVTLTLFIGGHIYRYQKDQFGWTSKSSEFLEKKHLRFGSLLFHWGIIFVFIGHVMGLAVPEIVYSTLGVSEEMYHWIAIIGGVPAGIVAILGLFILSFRRWRVKRIKVTTSKGDVLALVFLGIVMLSGLSATFSNIDSHGFDYRTTIGPWLRGLFYLNVQPELMAEVPVWFKFHIGAVYGLIVVWPFTRLVHVFSLPLRYLSRSYVVYKKRENRKAS